MNNDNSKIRSPEEIKKEIEELERQKRIVEEIAQQTMQRQLEQQANDLMQQALDQMNNNSMTL